MPTKHDLLSLLRYQYPSGVTTMGNCQRGCGEPARGGGVCRNCLCADLEAEGVSKIDVEEISMLLFSKSLAEFRIQEMSEEWK